VSTLAPESLRSGAVMHGPDAPRGRTGFEDGITLVGALNTLLERWRIVVGFPILTAGLAVVLAFVIRPTYTATTTFVSEARNQNRLPSVVAGLAGQFGVSLGTDPSQSPRFYASVVRSRELLERILLSRYVDPSAGAGATDSTTLLEILRIKGLSRTDSLAHGVKKLNDLISVRVNDETNIVRLGVDASHPALAAAVANRLVEYLNDFNTRKRQSQARERRKFTEQRVAAADSELRRAEEAVRTFYERNRGWQQAPELVFEEARLRRQVTIGQEVYLTLKREHETSRIEEVNATPVITVIDPAIPPNERSSPNRTLLVIMAFAFGGMIAAFWAFSAEYIAHVRRQQQDDYLRLSQRSREILRDLRRLLGRIVGRKERA